MTERIYRICIPHTFSDGFDYSSTQTDLLPGMRVLVPLRKKEVIGFVIEKVSTSLPTYKLKNILELLDDEIYLTADILHLCRWAARYYQIPLSEVIPLALPKKIRQAKEKKTKKKTHLFQSLFNNASSESVIFLNKEQEQVAQEISLKLGHYHCFLLQGVTGSGKTEVYLQIIKAVLDKQKQILVIVPEIGLTPQLLQRFQVRLDASMAVVHSGLNETERYHAWLAAKENHVQVIIGTRAAIFTPMPELGLIIIDEEHDASLKQMEGLHYSARDIALVRAHQANVPIILGSATPSLESYFNCMQQKYQHLHLKQKAMNNFPLHFRIIDLRNQQLQQGLATATLQCIEQHLKKDHQVLIFINRRGFAPVLLCHLCGWMADCKACDSHLTFHRKKNILQCHHCGYQQAVPHACQQCQGQEMIPVGIGTQRLQEFLQHRFPDYPVLRIDRDEVQRKHEMDRRLALINEGEAKLIVGTQMLAKGHHFPRLTLVVIVDTDMGFYHHDFRALEQLGQLITQVAGRAGRAEEAGEVLIQTHLPQHPLLNLLLKEGYEAFAQSLLAMRAEAELPPYQYLANIRCRGKNMEKLVDMLIQVKKFLQPFSIQIYGPAPAPLTRISNQYRMQLLLKAKSRKTLQYALTSLREWITMNKLFNGIRWLIDVDPLDLS